MYSFILNKYGNSFSYDMVQDAESELLLQLVFIICFVFEERQPENFFFKFYSQAQVYSVIDVKINKLGNVSIG